MAGGSYVAAGLDVLAKTKSRDKVFLRAYSFDAPSVLEALEGACARGAACCLIADASQCSKTNCAAIAVSVQALRSALICGQALAVLRKPSLLGLRQIVLRGCGHADHPRRITASPRLCQLAPCAAALCCSFASWLADLVRSQPCA